MAKVKKEDSVVKRKVHFGRLVGLFVALVDLGGAWVFATQDNRVLWGFAAVFVLQAGYWFVDNVVLSNSN